MSKVFYKAKNLIISNGFLRNPDRYYLEEYFEQPPLNNENSMLEWNYVNCAPPIISAGGKGSDNGAFAEGTNLGMIFPGQSGELYSAQLTFVGNFTTNGILPIIKGTIPDNYDNNVLSGLNLQLDHEGTDNSGCQITFGPENGNDYNQFKVGTDSGYIEATFITNEWTDWDVVSIGFRKIGPTQLGHNAVIGAGSGDPLYTDFATFGIQEPDKIQIATSLNGTTTYTDTTDTPNDSNNISFRVILNSSGAVTYEYGIGTASFSSTPSNTASFTFDNGDIIIPYIITHCVGQVDNELLLKEIKIYKSNFSNISYLNSMNKNFMVNDNTGIVVYSSDYSGILLTNDEGDTSSIIPSNIQGQSPWNSIVWGSQNEIEWECAISIPKVTELTGGASDGVQVGLYSGEFNRIFFETNTYVSPLLWNIVITINSLNYRSYIDGSIINNKIYKFRITIDSSRFARVYINDIQYNINSGSIPASVTEGVIPSKQLVNNINFQPSISMGSTTKLNIYYQKISRNLYQ